MFVKPTKIRDYAKFYAASPTGQLSRPDVYVSSWRHAMHKTGTHYMKMLNLKLLWVSCDRGIATLGSLNCQFSKRWLRRIYACSDINVIEQNICWGCLCMLINNFQILVSIFGSLEMKFIWTGILNIIIARTNFCKNEKKNEIPTNLVPWDNWNCSSIVIW